MPHPYGSHISGPSFILYTAGEKHKPRLLPLRGGAGGGGEEGDDDDPEVRVALDSSIVIYADRARVLTDC